jgi:hypothetical protein
MVLRYAHPTEQHQAEAAKRLEMFNTAMAIAEVEKAGQVAIVELPLQTIN